MLLAADSPIAAVLYAPLPHSPPAPMPPAPLPQLSPAQWPAPATMALTPPVPYPLQNLSAVPGLALYASPPHMSPSHAASQYIPRSLTPRAPASLLSG